MRELPITVSTELQAAYDAALQASLIVRHNPPGVLRLRGASTLDFLHRMSTNDLTGMTPGDVRGTVLTTAIGRTVDVVQVIVLPSEVLLLTTPGRSDAVREWLGRYIFFSDDVRIDVETGEWSSWGVYGPQAAGELGRLSLPAVEASDSFSVAQDGLSWRSAHPVPGLRLLAGPEVAARADEAWGEAARDTSGPQALEILRVEHGRPQAGKEIDEEVIPLEVGLWDLVSFSKGCYIGQEVIARMESRGRVSRHLAGVRMDQVEETPQQVLRGREALGRLTSAVISPRFGPIGLALVRGLTIDDGENGVTLSPSGHSAVLVPLPFRGDNV